MSYPTTDDYVNLRAAVKWIDDARDELEDVINRKTIGPHLKVLRINRALMDVQSQLRELMREIDQVEQKKHPTIGEQR